MPCFFLYPLSFCLLASLAGCAQDNRTAAGTGDPILGGGAAASGGRTALPPANPPARPPVAPPAAPASLTSNAALAVSTPATVDHNQDVRVGSASAATQYSGQYNPAPGGGAVLHRPEPAFEPPAQHDSMLKQVFGFTGASHGASYEQLKAQLVSRGVTFVRLETWGEHGGWKFTCSIPNRQNPYISRTYEAQAQDDLGAIRAVIAQMDKEQ
ncbi:MAG TPA: hypothetical protein VG013_19245 [Gemmataceae bacterium]|nr:hypothetical protein [Gemmataceae bacterium]